MSPRALPSLEGVWRREGRALDGGALVEPTWAHWVQAGHHFADVRAPKTGQAVSHWLDLPQGFSGTATAQGSVLTWTHDLDTADRPPGHSDVGEMEAAGDFLIERGPGYEEHWRQISPEGSPAAVAERRERGRLVARVVQVGALAAAVWSAEDAGGALLSGARGWELEYLVGSSALLDEASATAGALASAKPLPRGWEWVGHRGESHGGR